MIKVEDFYNELKNNQIDFYAGVPDSLLKNICGYITDNAPSSNNIIASNEGGAVALATGYHLATNKIPLVYMQNSGIGNCVNPFLSLTDKEVYSIPMLLMVGWRGEPGVKDEPQHIKQGKITIELFKTMGIEHFVLPTEFNEAKEVIANAINQIKLTQTPVALIVRKGTFDEYKLNSIEECKTSLTREQAIQTITDNISDGIVVSTTGMASRELFEYRKKLNDTHARDFLTVGSMGHANQIALGVALAKPERKVFCIDGDGAVIMHMGALSIIANANCKNLVHIVLNNGAHDSVGGQPTVGHKISLTEIAKANGYEHDCSVDDQKQLEGKLQQIKEKPGLYFIEVIVKKGARKDLGRPTNTPQTNKLLFKEFLNH